MQKEYRISAGAIIIEGERILLVKHGAARHGRDFLVGPRGRVEDDESIAEAATREVKEETGLEVSPDKIICIEDLVSPNRRVVKVWFLCRRIGGELANTQNAIKEGIVGLGWHSKEELRDEEVHPAFLMDADWREFSKDKWQVRCLDSKVNDDDL